MHNVQRERFSMHFDRHGAASCRCATRPVQSTRPGHPGLAWLAAIMVVLAACSSASARDKADSERTIVLHGKVVGPGNRPIAGARLYLVVDEWTDPVELGTSDVNGSYRLAVPEKKLRRALTPNFIHAQCQASLIATGKGFGPGWEELPDGSGGRMGEMKPEYAHDFHLVADFAIAGRIVDTGGKPVVRAAVAVRAMYDLADSRWFKMPAAIKAGDPNLMTREQVDPNNWFTPLYPTAWRMIPPATTDAEGRFQILGVGSDRAIRLVVTGPGIRDASISVLTRDDVADFTQAIRAKYPRTREPDGYFYPPRKNAPAGPAGVLLFGATPTIEVDPARTVAGVVRDADTGEPIAGVRIQSAGFYGQAETDARGRYRMLRVEDEPSILVYARPRDHERYLTVVRRLTDAKGIGEIAADFDVPRGVLVNGRVLESGTDRPIVSGARHHCHDPVSGGPVLAGYVDYFPLATNTVLRGTPTGLYFEGFPTGTANYSLSAEIDAEGRFRMAVPPGPGVLLIRSQPGIPGLAELGGGTFPESEGVHRLFPYVTLAARAKNDGAPAGDTQSLPGLTGPIPIAPPNSAMRYHAYRVINPATDATTLDLTLNVPRAASRVLRLVNPEYHAIRGVSVQGLVAPPSKMVVVVDGSEAEVLALEPGTPREVIATSNDGKYTVRFFVGTDDPQPRTIRLEAAGAITGRLLDDSTGLPLADFLATLNYPAEGATRNERFGRWGGQVKTDGNGRFLIHSVIPGDTASISLQEPVQPFIQAKEHQPNSLRGLVLHSGEVRDLGDIRIKPSAVKK